jgi:hypothetical protein
MQLLIEVDLHIVMDSVLRRDGLHRKVVNS